MGTPLFVNAIASSTLVAGPSGTKPSSEDKPKKNTTTNPKKKPLPLVNFKNYLKSGTLKPKICDKNLDFFNCESEYTYIPEKTEQCEDVRKSLNIPKDYGFCDGNPLLIMPKGIKAEDLEKFVGYKSKNNR